MVPVASSMDAISDDLAGIAGLSKTHKKNANRVNQKVKEITEQVVGMEVCHMHRNQNVRQSFELVRPVWKKICC